MSYPGAAAVVGRNVKPWLPALAALAAALLISALTAVALSGLAVGPGSSGPITLKTVTPGALERDGIRLSHAALPPECTPAAWLHLTVPGRCPISQAVAESTASSSVPVFRAVPMAADAAIVPGHAQVRESVLAWADIPGASAAGGNSLHALVWVVAVDEPLAGNVYCPPPVVRAQGMTAMVRPCFASPRYLVFIDAMSAKLRLLMARP